MIFDGAYKLENEEFITGEYHMEMSSIGADCTGYRPFEIEFLEPLKEKDYAKLEKKMQKELEDVVRGRGRNTDYTVLCAVLRSPAHALDANLFADKRRSWQEGLRVQRRP